MTEEAKERINPTTPTLEMIKEDVKKKKNYRELYKRIAESENFKKHYEGKSLGEVIDAGDNLSSVWHKGSEKPSIYKDKLTGNTLRTYALCIIWYDGWIEDLCRVTDDHKFASCTSDEVYDSEFFEYWAYTHDLIPKDL